MIKRILQVAIEVYNHFFHERGCYHEFQGIIDNHSSYTKDVEELLKAKDEEIRLLKEKLPKPEHLRVYAKGVDALKEFLNGKVLSHERESSLEYYFLYKDKCFYSKVVNPNRPFTYTLFLPNKDEFSIIWSIFFSFNIKYEVNHLTSNLIEKAEAMLQEKTNDN